ncbi:MAG: condensation domain-containing protein, partial [Candidatus Angelobacter sp.]
MQEFKLSPQQTILWGLLRDKGVPYWGQCAISIQGNLKIPVLRRALDRVIARNEVLRTAFVCDPEAVTAKVISSSTSANPLEMLDWSSLPPAEQESQCSRLF